MHDLYEAINDHLRYIEYVLDKSSKTVKCRKYILYHFARSMNVTDITAISMMTVEQWIITQRVEAADKNVKISGRLINNRLSHLKSFFLWCEDKNVDVKVNLNRLPKMTEISPRRKFYTRDTIQQVIEYATFDEALLIKMLFDSCMRRTEVATLRLANLDGRTINYIGEGKVESIAYIDDDTRILLDQWNIDQQITDYIFPSPINKSKPLNPDTICICRKISRAFKRIGIEGAYTHAMRHSGATDLELRGAPLQLISKILHHSKLTTTQIYTHGLTVALWR